MGLQVERDEGNRFNSTVDMTHQCIARVARCLRGEIGIKRLLFLLLFRQIDGCPSFLMRFQAYLSLITFWPATISSFLSFFVVDLFIFAAQNGQRSETKAELAYHIHTSADTTMYLLLGTPIARGNICICAPR